MRIFFNSLVVGSIVLISGCSSGSSNGNNIPSNSWAWVSGSNQSNAYGVYGERSVSSVSNIPGARIGAVSWVDESGNFWLFGGNGNSQNESGNLNDMWKYNPTSNKWTWMSGSNTSSAYGVYGIKGVASASNTPGARSGGTSWRDNAGNLWMFGGLGQNGNSTQIGFLGDLWKYNPISNQWTWVSGANERDVPGVYGEKGIAGRENNPGSRIGSTSWTDSSGNLWLFGGVDITAHRYNDLWKYNPNIDQWTWVSGDRIADENGIYGTQGVSGVINKPGARHDSVSWVDNSGNFWIFGGFGNGLNSVGLLNDLWKYNPRTNEWTWVKGSENIGQSGNYGAVRVSSDSNTPGARNHRNPLAWADKNGNLWMMGGFGVTNSGTNLLNDLWMFNPVNNQWTWQGGSYETNAVGIYGNIGSFNSNNTPGARRDAIGWMDNDSNLWLFGGYGNGASTTGNLNDLWKYNGIGAESAFPTVNYISFPGYNSSVTFVTGIRKVNNSSNVYISAIGPSTKASIGLLYAGPLNGQGGNWYKLNIPAPAGQTIQSTNLYGPNNGAIDGTVNIVGSYNTVESASTSFGVLYQGALTDGNNPNNWTLIMPPQAISTIAHSNMGDLVAGNYNINGDPAGKAFLYSIATKEYTEISKPGGTRSITIYGIWHNGGTSYTIAGGYSHTGTTGLDVGYIADYDISTHTISNWTDYSYNNLPNDSIVSHFEGITSDGNGGYNLAADVFAFGLIADGIQPSFVHVTRLPDGKFNPFATWSDVMYPNAVLTSANTVYENNLLGVYSYEFNLTQVNSFIATMPLYD
jgi:hypothetical protein